MKRTSTQAIVQAILLPVAVGMASLFAIAQPLAHWLLFTVRLPSLSYALVVIPLFVLALFLVAFLTARALGARGIRLVGASITAALVTFVLVMGATALLGPVALEANIGWTYSAAGVALQLAVVSALDCTLAHVAVFLMRPRVAKHVEVSDA